MSFPKWLMKIWLWPKQFIQSDNTISNYLLKTNSAIFEWIKSKLLTSFSLDGKKTSGPQDDPRPCHPRGRPRISRTRTGTRTSEDGKFLIFIGPQFPRMSIFGNFPDVRGRRRRRPPAEAWRKPVNLRQITR